MHCRRDRIGLDVGQQRAACLERADTAAQLAALGQRDKAGARLLQPGRIFGGGQGLSQRARDRRAGNRQQCCAAVDGLGAAVILACDEGEGGIADDAVLVTGRVTRVAQPQQLDPQAVSFGCQQQSVDRRAAAGLLVRQCAIEIHDVLYRITVQRLGRAIRQEVRQVGADHDQRLRSAPERFEHLRHFRRCCVADGQRHQFEIIEHRLQERQLNFQRVFARMRGRAHDNLGQIRQRRNRSLVNRDFAQRRLKGGNAWQCQAAHRDPVDRAEQHDAPDLAACASQSRISQRSRGA